MRIITCASYHGTGSSAISDLFSEFDAVGSLGIYEYRFLQDPNGISDLEFHVVQNNHRHNTSDAIKQFKRYVHLLSQNWYARGYQKAFGNQFESISNEYIMSITQLYTKSWWHMDQIERGRLFCFLDKVYSRLKRRILGELKTEKTYSFLQNREYGYFTSIDETEFLFHTKNYINKLFSYANKGNKNYLMVDQLIPPTNIERYLRYFDDVKVIVVDRDPRDIYILEKTQWKWGVIPTSSVSEYVDWFKITRHRNTVYEDPEKILRIRFEDMVYKYDETRKRLIEFVGLDIASHTRPRSFFNPAISIANTNLAASCHEFKEDISYIEKQLPKFIYDFPE